jgi:hypothetical protein
MTESSYASTTTPPKLDTELGTSDMDEFGNMFESFGKRKSTVIDGGEPKTPVPSTPSPVRNQLVSVLVVILTGFVFSSQLLAPRVLQKHILLQD